MVAAQATSMEKSVASEKNSAHQSQCSSSMWRFVLMEGFLVALLINSFLAWRECHSASQLQISVIDSETRGPSRNLESETRRRNVPGVYRQGIYSFGSDKLILCLIEKVASRVVLELGARVDGAAAWHTSQLGEMQAYAKTKKAVSSADLTNGVIPKIAMVRDPATRLLSGYISKLEAKGWISASSYAPNSPNETTSFEQFIEVLEGNPDMMQVNRHFRPQHLFCGFKHGVKYDCIIKYEDRMNGWKSCLSKLGMWDEFGATGWGPNNTHAIFDVQENYLNIDKPKVVTVTIFPSLLDKYYTPELLQRVYKLFEQDYEVFGYKLPLLEDSKMQ